MNMKFISLVLFGATLFAVNVPPTGMFDGPAQLPVNHVNSSLSNTPTPGNVIDVLPGTLQDALNNAKCGDIVKLRAGVTYTGNFSFPSKPCDDKHWIQVRTNALDTYLPGETSRINPCYSGVSSLPGRPSFKCKKSNVTAQIVSVRTGTTITFLPGANHYRIGPGIEITRPAGTGTVYALISKLSASDATDHIIIDRDWIHGTAQDETQRGIWASGTTYMAVINSYINDLHCVSAIGTCIDSQAISGGSGPLSQGIWKIQNNFLESAAENILFGGTAPNSNTPTDIEILKNHLFKPLIWMPGQSGFVGAVNKDTTKCTATPGFCPFIVKNLLEFKNASRVLVQGNILENAWAGYTQHGNSILVEGQNTSAPPVYSSISVTDLTVRYNTVAHTASGIAITNPPNADGLANEPIARFSVHDNLFTDISEKYKNGDTFASLALEVTYCAICTPSHDISVNHNTMVITSSKKMLLIINALSAKPIQNWVFTNNIVSTNAGLMVNGSGGNSCGFTGSTNLARIANCMDPYTMAGNLLIGADGTWPPNNVLPAASDLIQFNPNMSLSVTSPYKLKGTDGSDPGANILLISSHIVGVQ